MMSSVTWRVSWLKYQLWRLVEPYNITIISVYHGLSLDRLLRVYSYMAGRVVSVQFDCVTDYFLYRVLEPACAAYASLDLSLLHYITMTRTTSSQETELAYSITAPGSTWAQLLMHTHRRMNWTGLESNQLHWSNNSLTQIRPIKVMGKHENIYKKRCHCYWKTHHYLNTEHN